MAMLEVKNLSVSYGDLTVVDGVSFTVESNQWLMLVGPNGAGKSTVLQAISGIAPYQGTVLLEGENIRTLSPRKTAKKMGMLSQQHAPGYGFTVGQVVRLGRYAYSSNPFDRKGNIEGEAIVDKALRLTGLTHAERQPITTLSGGELQRTFLAQLIAQDPKLLLLDEPTNHLDLIYQKEVFALIREWLRQENVAVVSVVHDLSIAKAYGSHVLLMDHGRCLAQGELEQVLTRGNLQQVYQMDVYQWMNELHDHWKE